MILLLCLKDNQKVLTLGELMTKGQFQVQEKPLADLDDAISSLVTEEGLCDTQTYYKYETLPLLLLLKLAMGFSSHERTRVLHDAHVDNLMISTEPDTNYSNDMGKYKI